MECRFLIFVFVHSRLGSFHLLPFGPRPRCFLSCCRRLTSVTQENTRIGIQLRSLLLYHNTQHTPSLSQTVSIHVSTNITGFSADAAYNPRCWVRDRECWKHHTWCSTRLWLLDLLFQLFFHHRHFPFHTSQRCGISLSPIHQAIRVLNRLFMCQGVLIVLIISHDCVRLLEDMRIKTNKEVVEDRRL